MDQKGITLVEVLVSLVIAALVIMAVITSTGQIATISYDTDRVYACANIAKMRIEVLQKFSFADILASADETNIKVNKDGNSDSSGEYYRSTTITPNYNSNIYLLKISVSVDRITNGTASGNPVVIETLKADITQS